MAERWYLVPMVRGVGPRANERETKYVGTETTGAVPIVDTRPGDWSAMDFGPHRDDLCVLVCFDITDVEHAKLAAMPDVWDIPADVGRIIEPGTRGTFQAWLSTRGINPAGIGPTYETAIDEILAELLVSQQHYGVDRRGQGEAKVSKSDARAEIARRKLEALGG